MDEDLMEESFLQNDEPIPSVEGLNMPAIAKTVANKTVSLTESDDIILGTEHVMQNLHAFVRGKSASGLELDLALGTAVEESLRVWRPQYKSDSGRDRMGPGANASSFTKALYLTSLLLPLHHPALRSQNQHSTFKTSRALDQPKPIPQVLVEWLQAYHTPYPGEVEETLNFQPNACASDRFWDVVLSSVVRGSIVDGLKLLKEADFREAETALQEGAAERGYRGKQLGNVQRVVNRAIAVLEACPAVQSNDWNVSNADWAIFRKRVDQAMQDLASFADGPGHGNGEDSAFESENFGLASVRSDDFGLSRLPRRLPFPVQESLQALYNNLLGNGREITSSSADWLEATICQTLWWNGEEEEIGNVSFTASRNQQSLIRAKQDRPVDIMPRTAYRQKLSLSLRQVFAESEDQELQVNTSSSVEVGLACVLEDDLDGVLTILRGWSMPMSAMVVEIAALGQWPGLSTPSQDIIEQFSQSDLMVLGLSQNSPKNGHDDVLLSYADLLFKHADLKSTTYQAQQEGWELAIQLAGRVSIPNIANDRITSFLDKLDLSSTSDVESEDTSRIEKVMALCERLALSPLARRTAERYASDLSDHTHNYGGSLYYFARAHNLARVKEVLNLLISSCLVQSLAYPPKPDHTLQSLLITPKQALAKLSLLDHEAAEMLSTHFSGYAMLRNFYDLRDQEISAAAAGKKPASRPIARKKAAAAALVAVITSAADSIHGGLYDASVDSIIPIDGLLVLLGEALVFLSRTSSFHPPNILMLIPTSPTRHKLTLSQRRHPLPTLHLPNLASPHHSYSRSSPPPNPSPLFPPPPQYTPPAPTSYVPRSHMHITGTEMPRRAIF